MSKDVDMEGNFNVVSLMRHWMEKGDEHRAMMLVALFSESMPQLEEHYKALGPQSSFALHGVSISSDTRYGTTQDGDYFDKNEAKEALSNHLMEYYAGDIVDSEFYPHDDDFGLEDWMSERNFDGLCVLLEELSDFSYLTEAKKYFSLWELKLFLKGEIFFKE